MMNLWQQFALSHANTQASQGISLHFEKGIDPEFRRLCIKFASWLRQNYSFPIHANIYIKNCRTVRLMNGRFVYGSFRFFETKPPYIRIPAQIDPQEYEECEDIEIYYSILGSLVHELTHYFQWVAGLDQSDAVSERQANHFRFRIIEQFCEDCSLPY
jgi:hypothetical protein